MFSEAEHQWTRNNVNRTFIESLVHNTFVVLNWILLLFVFAMTGWSAFLFTKAVSNNPEKYSGNSERFWFPSVVSSMSVWFLCIAVLNFAGIRIRYRRCLIVSGALLLISVFTEIIVMLIIVFHGINPDHWIDRSKHYQKIHSFFADNFSFFISFILVLGAFQILLAIFAFMKAVYEKKVQDSKWASESSNVEQLIENDHMSESVANVNSRHSIFGSTYQQSSGRKEHDWSVDIRKRYGLDMRQFTYDPSNPQGRDSRISSNTPRSTPVLGYSESLDKEKQSNCNIM